MSSLSPPCAAPYWLAWGLELRRCSVLSTALTSECRQKGFMVQRIPCEGNIEERVGRLVSLGKKVAKPGPVASPDQPCILVQFCLTYCGFAAWGPHDHTRNFCPSSQLAQCTALAIEGNPEVQVVCIPKNPLLLKEWGHMLTMPPSAFSALVHLILTEVPGVRCWPFPPYHFTSERTEVCRS